MWTLVFINLIFNAEAGYKEPFVEAWYEFDSMEQCFNAREQLLTDLGTDSEFYPVNTQAVCIRSDG